MNRNAQAQQHLLALILGRDPNTNAPISPDTALLDPEIIRSLVLAKEALADGGKGRTGEEPARAGKPWTESEDKQLQSAFAAGSSLKEIQNSLGRSDEGIVARLVRLGLVNSREQARAMFR